MAVRVIENGGILLLYRGDEAVPYHNGRRVRIAIDLISGEVVCHGDEAHVTGRLASGKLHRSDEGMFRDRLIVSIDIEDREMLERSLNESGYARGILVRHHLAKLPALSRLVGCQAESELEPVC